MLTDEQAQYLYANTRYMVLARRCLNASDAEEMIQAIVVHISKYWSYDPSLGYSWKTYAISSIYKLISSEMRKHWQRVGRHEELKEDMTIEAPPDYDEGIGAIEELVEDETLRRMLTLKYEGYSNGEIARAMGIRQRLFMKVFRILKAELRKAVSSGAVVDCSEALSVLNGRGKGRPSEYLVEVLDEHGNVTATYDSINKMCKATGFSYHTIVKAMGRTGGYKRRGVRWRIVAKPAGGN